MKASLALPLLLAANAVFAAAPAAPADDAILHCRSLSEAGARLACYDAIPLGHAGAPVAAMPAAAPAHARAPVATPEQSFGMDTVKRAEPETPRFIDSAIPGRFSGWGPTSQFTLANGQVWRVVDGSEAVLAPMQDPKVRIVRNFFGTTFLEIAGTNNSPKVRRVR
jgi:hypothetical protein